jgi:hypothetical protein
MVASVTAEDLLLVMTGESVFILMFALDLSGLIRSALQSSRDKFDIWPNV